MGHGSLEHAHVSGIHLVRVHPSRHYGLRCLSSQTRCPSKLASRVTYEQQRYSRFPAP